MSAEERIGAAVEIATRYGGSDGSHHKQWVIDQMLRALLSPEEYARWAAEMAGDPDDEANYYGPWDEGIPP